MSEDEFVKAILTGLTPPPGYFPKNVLMNIQGYESLDTVMQRAHKALNAEAFEITANETDALLLDTRDASEFAVGFIPNSINIGLAGNFAQWVGEMIPDIKQKILLITNIGDEEEAVIRLARVGYDGEIGYLDGGFETWKKTGKEIEHLNRINPVQFKKEYLLHPIVFDVRKKSEFDTQHVQGAINIPLNEINLHLSEFPKDKPFIIHCAGGYRSMIAASILKQRGWNDFSDVIGGFTEIEKTGVPTTHFVCPTTML